MKLNPKGEVPVFVEGERVIVGSEAIVKHICDKPEGINLTPAAHKARIDKLVSHVNAVDIRKLVYGHFIATNAGAIQRAVGTVVTGTRPSLCFDARLSDSERVFLGTVGWFKNKTDWQMNLSPHGRTAHLI